MGLKSSSPVNLLKGVGAVYAEKLRVAGVTTLLDLLMHLPVDYLDCGREVRELSSHRPGLFSGRLLSIRLSRNYARRRSTVRLGVESGAGTLQALLFNQPYLARQLAKGQKIWLFGRVEPGPEAGLLVAPRLFLSRPEGVIPVYRDLAGIPSGRVRNLIRRALESVSEYPEILPGWIRERNLLMGRERAIRLIHQPEPEELDTVDAALDLFRYMEFLEFHLELALVRRKLKNPSRRFHYADSKNFIARLTRRLGFALTADQGRAVSDILSDLRGPTAMQRLIQGDVGTGKTAVAFSAMLTAVQNGYQAVFLAPTELLARQHEENARKFFSGFSVAVLTGSTSTSERRRIEKEVREGRLQLIFGTHALISGSLAFRNLAMIVIDEQQRFGVSQRASLYCKSRGADLLVTTATPIPRTLLLVLYNDLSVSTIRSRPHGIRKVKTRVLDAGKRGDFYQWLENRLAREPAAGRVFVILPRIRQTDSGDGTSSLEVEGEALAKRFATHGAAILSSETTPIQRQRILRDFRNGKIRILISTTVVELGIDVAEADTMVVENADRFGLAQLHQLRGRIGRSGRPGYCYLLRSGNPTPTGMKRLSVLAAEEDGFRLAEKDLEIRGGGEVAGVRQAGSLDFRFGDPLRHHRIFSRAREDAARVIADPESRSDGLNQFIDRFHQKIDKLHFS